MKNAAFVFMLGCVAAIIFAGFRMSCAKIKRQHEQASTAVEDAEDAWNRFVATTNQRATNEANWHTNNMPNHSVGVFFSGMRAITNTVAVKEYGVVFGVLGDGDVAPKYLHLPIVLSCGNGLVLGPGVTIPTNDVPCPCGNTNHWLWRFGKL